MDFVIDILKKLNVVPVPLLDAQAQVVKARALMEANRAGVFVTLGKHEAGLTVSELAAAHDFSEEGAKVLLDALVGVGYLKKKNGRYTNGRWVKKWFLDPKHSLHYMLRLQMYTYHRLEGLGENLKSGRPAMDFHAMDVSHPTPQQETYTRAMREAARLIIPDLMKRVDIPASATRLLDIGGAHGEYSRTFVRKFPNLKATVLDLAGPVATAKEIMEVEGNPEGLDLQVGNCLSDDFGTGWDAILLVNMVHLFDVAQNLDLFKRCKSALKPGGSLLCVDQFVGISGQRDKIFALVSLNFFNVGGKSYEAGQMRELLAEAGFGRVEVKPLGLRTPASLIQAYV
ncbi:methyltransferase [Hydrocarboniphaga sp.]|uniref:methyltransferase n=1 Tax=Hydrocarboniphaga sp. TaxID=2033016 RepID=UPI003D13701E